MDELRERDLEDRVRGLDSTLAALPTQDRASILLAVAALLDAWAPPSPRNDDAWERRSSSGRVADVEELRYVANRLRLLATGRK